MRVIVAFPPGGSNDVTARTVFQKMSETIGQRFVIDNRGGASGTIGSAIVARSPPDGYTVMIASSTHVANPHLYDKLPYDALNDFIGVTTLAIQSGILAVHPSLPVKSVREFSALAKKRPGEILYASAGSGGIVHLSMALFMSMTGTNMTNVPYAGAGPALIALIAGETQAMIASIGSIFPHIKANRVRPIAVASDTRVKQFPDIPTIGETVPGYEFTAWVGAFVPAGTPKPIVDRLNAEFRKALADPGVLANLSNQTLDSLHMTPVEFAQRMKADYEKYRKLIQMTGAKSG